MKNISIGKLERNRIIHIMLVLVSIIAIITALYFPKVKNINLTSREISNLRKVVEKLTQIDNKPDEFYNKRDKVSNGLKAIREKIPELSMIPQVIRQITEPVNELGISLSSITPLEPVSIGSTNDGIKELSGVLPEENSITGAEYIKTSIGLSMKASYKQAIDYLDRIRHLPRLITIDEFDIKKNTENDLKLDVNIKLSVYHYGKD